MGSGGSGGGGGGGGGGGVHPGRNREQPAEKAADYNQKTEIQKQVEDLQAADEYIPDSLRTAYARDMEERGLIPDKDLVNGPGTANDEYGKLSLLEKIDSDSKYNGAAKILGDPNADMFSEEGAAKMANAMNALADNPNLRTVDGMGVGDIWVIGKWTEMGQGGLMPGKKDSIFQNMTANGLSAQLWGTASITKAGKLYSERLSESLDHVPKYNGKSYRTITYNKGGDLPASFEVGKTFTTKAFMGTSYKHSRISTPDSAKQLKGGTTGAIHVTVTSKSGHQLDYVSKTGEYEILNKPGTTFMTTSKTWSDARQVWDIKMKEI